MTPFHTHTHTHTHTHLDLVVIAARHKQWLLLVKADATHRAIMLIKLVDQCTHAVVPQLNYTIVQ